MYCDGKFVQTCSISVIAKGYKFYKPVIKNVKYAGKELYYYDPFTNKTSGKLKVTPAKGYKIVSIEYSTGLNAKTGDYTYKKIKNNGKIKLLKQRKYTRKYNEGTEYESQYAYNSLFPVTQIRITLQNKKTKEKVKTVNDFIYKDLANKMKEVMGTKVSIASKGNGKGKIEIEYYSDEELERMFDMIMSIGKEE